MAGIATIREKRTLKYAYHKLEVERLCPVCEIPNSLEFELDFCGVARPYCTACGAHFIYVYGVVGITIKDSESFKPDHRWRNFKRQSSKRRVYLKAFKEERLRRIAKRKKKLEEKRAEYDYSKYEE